MRVQQRRPDRAALVLLVTLAILLLVGAALMLAMRLMDKPSAAPGIAPVRVYAVCQQYASLDLSGMASLCKDVGYQQQYVQPTGAPVWWPTARRVVHPEDLDR